jgi:hypothetical protein
MPEQEFYLLEIAAALAAELGTGAAHVMGRQFFQTHLSGVLLNDLQHGAWREILTPDFAALAHCAKDLARANAGRVGPRVDGCFHPGGDRNCRATVKARIRALYLSMVFRDLTTSSLCLNPGFVYLNPGRS